MFIQLYSGVFMYRKIGITACSDPLKLEFQKKMESMLDGMKFPQSFMENRVFQAPTEIKAETPLISSQKRGTCGTFRLRVLFRQNTSWQGAVTWVEGAREETFRSALELLLLMDSAICVKTKKE